MLCKDIFADCELNISSLSHIFHSFTKDGVIKQLKKNFLRVIFSYFFFSVLKLIYFFNQGD